MQSAGSRTSQKYLTTKEWNINLTSVKLTGYSAHFFKKKKKESKNFKFEMKNNFKKNVSIMLLVWVNNS